ncbi:MAG: cysteine desulfurase [Actinobacteria bacterium]|nr:cysteine desulfurase [Actinomycetota bacterium]
MRQEAIEAMTPFMSGIYANPSGSHRFSRIARKAIDEARDDVAEILGCKVGEVVFTSGGTEGDNAAIFGAARRRAGIAVCSAAEHHAVLHCVENLKGQVVGVDATGVIDVAELERVLQQAQLSDDPSDRVSVVSVMAVNNEVGSISPLRQVAKVVRANAPDAVLHTDAVQATCWQDLREISKLVDVLSVSAHKFGGPKGMGITVQRLGLEIDPLIVGGGQERDRRSGTHNVAGIMATAAALRSTDTTRDTEVARVTKLRDALVDGVMSQLDDVVETVPRDKRVAGIAHICIAGCESESVLYLLDEAMICASAASACASGAMEPSHVLTAMGVDKKHSMGALRMSLGHTTTEGEIDRAISALVGVVRQLRRNKVKA